MNLKIKSVIADELTVIINDLIKDPTFYFKINNIKLQKKISTFNAQEVNNLIITIETNNRPLLLGQFIYFKTGSMRGFHIDYLTAKTEELLRNETNNPEAYFEIHFEIRPSNKMTSLHYVYSCIDFKTALNLGLLTGNSLLAKKMKKYDLKYLILAGHEISGPSYGMIKSIEKICKKFEIKKCLDLFSGTGTLTKVALSNNAIFSDCVDTNIEVIRNTLAGHEGKYHTFESNAFDFKPRGKYDLLILDPFYDFTLDVAQNLLPHYKEITTFVVFNLGLRVQNYWVSQIKKSIGQISEFVTYENIGENVIGIIKFDK